MQERASVSILYIQYYVMCDEMLQVWSVNWSPCVAWLNWLGCWHAPIYLTCSVQPAMQQPCRLSLQLQLWLSVQVLNVVECGMEITQAKNCNFSTDDGSINCMLHWFIFPASTPILYDILAFKFLLYPIWSLLIHYVIIGLRKANFKLAI